MTARRINVPITPLSCCSLEESLRDAAPAVGAFKAEIRSPQKRCFASGRSVPASSSTKSMATVRPDKCETCRCSVPIGIKARESSPRISDLPISLSRNRCCRWRRITSPNMKRRSNQRRIRKNGRQPKWVVVRLNVHARRCFEHRRTRACVAGGVHFEL